MEDTFDGLIEGVKNQFNSDPNALRIQLRGMKLLTESINRFNTASGKLSGDMIKIYWLQVLLIVIQIGIAGLQVGILLGQIYKWW